MTWTIVKVGGSLYDWPMLGPRLRDWLDELDAQRVLIVPGGGAAANAVRAYDGVHHLGEESSHWLAIQALTLNARFLQKLLPHAQVIAEPRQPPPVNTRNACFILEPFPFFQQDEQTPGALPHLWQVTSDSLAVRLAAALDAHELVLLKSVAWLGADWVQAAQAKVVDGYFVEALKQTSTRLRTRIVNLRAWSPIRSTVSNSPTP